MRVYTRLRSTRQSFAVGPSAALRPERDGKQLAALLGVGVTEGLELGISASGVGVPAIFGDGAPALSGPPEGAMEWPRDVGPLHTPRRPSACDCGADAANSPGVARLPIPRYPAGR